MTIKILTVVGARPQFIKAAVVSSAIRECPDVDQTLVHTGQHHDENMSQVFFDEMGIPDPDHNLGISGGTHAEMTAAMMVALEKVIDTESPDVVLLYGDTNSTLAAALTAAKMQVPTVHVEAGPRSRLMSNPEEINRICTDHVAVLLLACTQESVANLEAEGLGERAVLVGDPMYDAFLHYSKIAHEPVLSELGTSGVLELPSDFYYLTSHRQENTADPETLSGIISSMESLDFETIYPVHPRNRSTALEVRERLNAKKVHFVDPVGYLESVYLTNHAQAVVTDSGGLQREAFFAEVKCITLFDYVVWPETMVDGRNVLARPEKESILSAFAVEQSIDESYKPFGDGRASQRIVQSIVDLCRPA